MEGQTAEDVAGEVASLTNEYDNLRRIRGALGERISELNRQLGQVHREDALAHERQQKIDVRMVELTGDPQWWMRQIDGGVSGGSAGDDNWFEP